MNNTILDFIKNWIPSIGVIIGSLWVLYRWIYDQKIRRRKEMPALTGSVVHKIIEVDKENRIINLEMEWNNSSPFPIYIDTQKSRIDIFKLPEDMDLGFFEVKNDLGKPKFRGYPLKDTKDFVFEPKTNNQLRGNFLLDENGIYYIRAKVYRDNKKHGDKIFAWTREQIVDLRK